MRWMLVLILLGCASLSSAQDKVRPASLVVPADPTTRPVSKMSVEQQQCYFSAQRGMEWLRRCNRPDGRFVYGFLPALCQPMEGDDYVSQAEAVLALARSARYFRDDQTLVIARQALLTLLLDTAPDPKEARVRFTVAPPQILNRLASHGMLLRAIHELTVPGKDLLDQSETLANYLYQQQRPDGSLFVAETGEDVSAIVGETQEHAAGLALQGIIQSQKHRPAPWKLDALRKGQAFYTAQWQKQKNLPLVVGHTGAYAEAYRQTKEKAFAEAVFAFNDWLVGMQYQETNSRQKAFVGGFPPWADGKSMETAPDIRSARCAETLAEACLVAKQVGDLPRYQRYGLALEKTLHFLNTLQYTPDRTRHYLEEFRPAVRGAFHATHQDGNLRIDYTSGPLLALATYLEQIAE